MDSLPPAHLWPDRIYAPELQYGDSVNLATELLEPHIEAGRGSATAIAFHGVHVSYADLRAQVNRTGHALRALGVEPGDRVMLRMRNRPEFVVTWLAVQKIGAVAVATMPMLRARELSAMIEDCGARLVVVAGDLLEEAAAAVARLAVKPALVHAGLPGAADADTLEGLASRAPGDLDPYPTPRDAVALIAYTSGSTGVPKGACHSSGDILASADTYLNHVLCAGPGDAFGGHPTLAFTYGLGGLLVFPLRAGAATVLTETFTPPSLLALVARERLTLLFCAATTYRLLLQVPDLETYDLSSLRLCISAGEPLPKPVYDEWTRRTRVELLDSLGTTEMFHVFICARPGRVRPGVTGEVLPGYEAKIVDERLTELPRGTPGLLAVRGPTGCRYWNQPARQREYVRGGWNLPNDVCVQDGDGFFHYQCRNDDLIICAGYNIAGPEIEAVLIEHPAVLEAAVVAAPDPSKGQVPMAFVVLKADWQGSATLADQLRACVTRELAPYKYPRKVAFVASLPKTETGKIKRAELRESARHAP
jgi:2-aminobenzoate-CoA ligase